MSYRTDSDFFVRSFAQAAIPAFIGGCAGGFAYNMTSLFAESAGLTGGGNVAASLVAGVVTGVPVFGLVSIPCAFLNEVRESLPGYIAGAVVGLSAAFGLTVALSPDNVLSPSNPANRYSGVTRSEDKVSVLTLQPEEMPVPKFRI